MSIIQPIVRRPVRDPVYPWGRPFGLSFDGVGNYIDTSISFPQDQSFTVEVWINPDDVSSFQRYLGNDVSGNGQLVLRIKDTGEVDFYVRDSGGGFQSVTGPILNINTWYHVVGTYDTINDEIKLYLDGTLYGPVSVGASTLASTTNNMYIGGCSNRYYGGYQSDVRIWSDVRTQTEIQANMNRRLTGLEPGLVAYYPLEQGYGGTAYDKAGGNHGTINGATWIKDNPF